MIAPPFPQRRDPFISQTARAKSIIAIGNSTLWEIWDVWDCLRYLVNDLSMQIQILYLIQRRLNQTLSILRRDTWQRSRRGSWVTLGVGQAKIVIRQCSFEGFQKHNELCTIDLEGYMYIVSAHRQKSQGGTFTRLERRAPSTAPPLARWSALQQGDQAILWGFLDTRRVYVLIDCKVNAIRASTAGIVCSYWFSGNHILRAVSSKFA